MPLNGCADDARPKRARAHGSGRRGSANAVLSLSCRAGAGMYRMPFDLILRETGFDAERLLTRQPPRDGLANPSITAN